VDECKPLARGPAAEAGSVTFKTILGAKSAQYTLGKKVQVDPIKPTLKAPETKHTILEHDKLLSNFGFKFNLRCYNLAGRTWGVSSVPSAPRTPLW
jgi:hypothetical protein